MQHNFKIIAIPAIKMLFLIARYVLCKIFVFNASKLFPTQILQVNVNALNLQPSLHRKINVYSAISAIVTYANNQTNAQHVHHSLHPTTIYVWHVKSQVAYSVFLITIVEAVKMDYKSVLKEINA